jgi:DNA-binding beta-propeller fold protein YncE
VNNGAGTVTPISTATNTAGPAIKVGKYPFAIAIAPDGLTAYVANYGAGTVTPISTATNGAGAVGHGPIAIAITPLPPR